MTSRISDFVAAAVVGIGALLSAAVAAQDVESVANARAAAPIDLEGYWVSLITEDWRWRMVTPAKGDYASVPLNDQGIRMADAWEPSAHPNSCLPYGAPNLMRMPLRVHITWSGPNTLRVETDHGMQVRELRFEPDGPRGAPSRQGDSVARWDGTALEVRTTNLVPGYLRRNGVPYSASAEVTEYYNTHSAFGSVGFTVTTIVHDPFYLTEDFVTSSTFRKLEDGSSWHPVPCTEP